GSLCALLGPNAAGKTTLLKGICGLTPHRGKCFVEGAPLTDMNEREMAHYISYIPQRCTLQVPISVMDVVLMGYTAKLSFFGSPSNQVRVRGLEALSQVGMAEQSERSYLELSEGQRQLVILARALVQDTPLMIFDEPDSALDFTNKHKVLSMIQSTIVGAKKGGLICIHDPNFALRYCNSALLLYEGRLIEHIEFANATTEELREALSRLYGGVDILTHNGHYIMTKS
ncbi:MAG: ABC transporter ATP-binding protein, partial [Eubacteriales bacterium]